LADDAGDLAVRVAPSVHAAVESRNVGSGVTGAIGVVAGRTVNPIVLLALGDLL